MYSAILLGTLVSISGFIAFVGDRLGRLMGKRRIVFWGLRPRHTAIVTTIITGMFITLFTMGMLSLVSGYIKSALFQIDGILRQQKILQTRGAELSEKVDKLETRIKLRTKELNQTKGKLAEKIKESNSLSQEVNRKTSQLKQLSIKFKNTQDRLLIVNSQLRGAQRHYQEVSADLQEIEKEMTNAQKAFGRLTESIRRLDEEIRKRDEEIRDLDEKIIEMQKQIREGESQRNILETERNRLEEERNRLQADKDRLNQDLERLQREVAQLEGLKTLIASVRTGKIVWERNQPLLTKVVPSRLSEGEIREQLESIVSEANRMALERGAQPFEENKAVWIIKKVGDKLYFEPDILKAITEEISESAESVIVRLIAQRNCVEGEPVVADFELYRNKLVFQKDEEIARVTVNPKEAPVEIFKQLILMLTKEVNQAAGEQGMMPGPEGKFGEMKYEDLFQILEKIKKYKKPVKVYVLAAEDTWTAGPLKVKFKIEG